MENQEVVSTKKNLLIHFHTMDWRSEVTEILTGTNYLKTYVEAHSNMMELITLNQYNALFTSLSTDRLKNLNYLKDVSACSRELRVIFISEHILEESCEGLSVYKPLFKQRPLNRTDLIRTIEGL